MAVIVSAVYLILWGPYPSENEGSRRTKTSGLVCLLFCVAWLFPILARSYEAEVWVKATVASHGTLVRMMFSL